MKPETRNPQPETNPKSNPKILKICFGNLNFGNSKLFRYSLFDIRIFIFFCVVSALILISGCASTKEVCKGLIGISTKVLEDSRKDAIKKEFDYNVAACGDKIKEILKLANSYIYWEDPQKNMLALYISESDTTAVGVFLTETGKEKTLVEVSSPSTYGRESISRLVFEGLSGNLDLAIKKGIIDAPKKETEPE